MFPPSSRHETMWRSRVTRGPHRSVLLGLMSVCHHRIFVDPMHNTELLRVISALPVNDHCWFLSGFPGWLEEPEGSASAAHFSICMIKPTSRGSRPSPSIAGVILLVDVLKWSGVNTDLMKSGYWLWRNFECLPRDGHSQDAAAEVWCSEILAHRKGRRGWFLGIIMWKEKHFTAKIYSALCLEIIWRFRGRIEISQLWNQFL